jgi:hypothetical protein
MIQSACREPSIGRAAGTRNPSVEDPGDVVRGHVLVHPLELQAGDGDGFHLLPDQVIRRLTDEQLPRLSRAADTRAQVGRPPDDGVVGALLALLHIDDLATLGFKPKGHRPQFGAGAQDLFVALRGRIQH